MDAEARERRDAMTEAVERLRTELRDLYDRRSRGDLRDRDYQKKATELSLDLYRAVVRARLRQGETVLAQHHAVRAHMRLNQSLLRETDQEAVSLFLTDRRLIRLRSVLAAGRPVSADRQDQTVVDEVALERVRAVSVRREVRVGEAVAGAIIIGGALLFQSFLLVTGKLLVLAGGLGIVHALFLPTRWFEVELAGRPLEPPLQVIASRRKSARVLARMLRERIRARG